MKGCLAVFGVLALLLIVLFAGCTGFLFYKGHQLGQQHEETVARLHQLDVSYPFTPPGDGLLDGERLTLFVQARAASTGPIERMFAQAGQLEKMEEDGGDVGFFEAMSTAFGAVKGIAQTGIEAPKALAASLEERQMSFAEFDWINGVVHATIRRAADAGEEPAVALEEAITKMFGTSKNVEVNNQAYDERVLDELEDRITSWKPENLALISQHAGDIAGGLPVLMVDIFAANMAENRDGDASTKDE